MRPEENGTGIGPSPNGPQREDEGQERPRTPFRDLPRAKQAGMRIREPSFRAWLKDTYRGAWLEASTLFDDEQLIADCALKKAICIISKRDLDTWEEAGQLWDKMNASYDMREYAR